MTSSWLKALNYSSFHKSKWQSRIFHKTCIIYQLKFCQQICPRAKTNRQEKIVKHTKAGLLGCLLYPMQLYCCHKYLQIFDNICSNSVVQHTIFKFLKKLALPKFIQENVWHLITNLKKVSWAFGRALCLNQSNGG